MSGTAASYASTGSGPSPGKGVQADAAQRPDSAAVAKRLQQELMSMMTSGDKGISAFPQGDSLFSWVGTIEVGREGDEPWPRTGADCVGAGSTGASEGNAAFVQLAKLRLEWLEAASVRHSLCTPRASPVTIPACQHDLPVTMPHCHWSPRAQKAPCLLV